ncbi:MAG: hypothetical protein IPK82_11215 [Polyangiaceae bacterium]|nr:hypothetical protein [Polyangiaceae bacterium]
MNQPPMVIGSARVLRWSVLDEGQRPTGGWGHIVGGNLQGPVAGLAICECGGETVYLFGCDAEWNVVTDTWHETLEKALRQAEFEYEGVTATWKMT